MDQKNSKCDHFLRSKSDIRSIEKGLMLVKVLLTTVLVKISLKELLAESKNSLNKSLKLFRQGK